jgi:mono/diheme cytochrome c family protein
MMRRSWVVLAALLSMTVAARQEPSRSIWDGVFTDAQAARGEKAFQAQCASCHAVLKGSSDATAPALSGSEFMERWADQSVGEIFQTMRTTMPPSAPASLSKEAYADILAYVLKANKYPAGSAELVPDAAKLGQIVVEPKPR